MIPLADDRVRVRRWEAADVELGTVVARLHALQAELSQHDVDHEDHPHPRNCVLNLVVTLGDRHRVEMCDRVIAGLAASHPLRAILLHLDESHGHDGLDAAITSEAHQLVAGFPVQREQVLLHVRGGAARHLASLVEPLLVPDIPTYLWWSGHGRLDEAALGEVEAFSDVLVVDSTRFKHPVESLLELASFAADPDAEIGLADFGWDRMRPWRDAIGQFFAPMRRQAMLAGLREVGVDAAGAGPEARVGATLLAGWVAGRLGWRLVEVSGAGEATKATAEAAGGAGVRLSLRSVTNDRLHHGELLSVRLAGQHGGRTFALTVERDAGGDPHAHVTIELGGGEPVRQRLPLPRLDDSTLLVHALLGSRRDTVYPGALSTAMPLLEALR